MADIQKESDGPSPYDERAYDFTQLPDYDNDFIEEADITEFAKALAAPENSPSTDDLTAPQSQKPLFITALNDWRPVRQRVRKRKRQPQRGKDETREGFVYTLLKWPLLFGIFGWLAFLSVSYLFTRLYIYLYEHWVTWRGTREHLRKRLQNANTYEEWVAGAKELDKYLGNDEWKRVDEYAYYDSKTIRRVTQNMSNIRAELEVLEKTGRDGDLARRLTDELRGILEVCVKNNFVGFENPHLYSETYYGTKELVQSFVDEAHASLNLLRNTPFMDQETKHALFKHASTNFGKTALCLSGGATFAYYHFGVAKALLDADLLPDVITGTSGGALVASLLGTRTNEELKKLLVPALAHRITACQDDIFTWIKRWYRTGARFDSIDWARRCSWFTRGSMTFREAYQRTGRILNVSCVPSDPHSPTILANYITSPDCVIWSAVIASAAVPGILNPVVLMKKNPDGTLAPYSFGHKWKDGSLRTDIPLKALNLHFNVRFSIVSQVNPHINLFFFSSRGSVGRPVTHRRGRGWRGGFLGSATEQFIKLDLTKWLKVLRHLELLPRPMGQDWSEIWLQRFSGTITIWPKSIPSDFLNILTDPTPERLARMIHVGQLSAFPKLKFIANRMKLERLIDAGRRATRPRKINQNGILAGQLSEEDLRGLLREAKRKHAGGVAPHPSASNVSSTAASTAGDRTPIQQYEANQPRLRIQRLRSDESKPDADGENPPSSLRPESPSFRKRISGWFSRKGGQYPYSSIDRPTSMFELGSPPPVSDEELKKLYARAAAAPAARRGSFMKELDRQSRIFWDDQDFPRAHGRESEAEKEGEGDAEVEGSETSSVLEEGESVVSDGDKEVERRIEEWGQQGEGRSG